MSNYTDVTVYPSFVWDAEYISKDGKHKLEFSLDPFDDLELHLGDTTGLHILITGSDAHVWESRGKLGDTNDAREAWERLGELDLVKRYLKAFCGAVQVLTFTANIDQSTWREGIVWTTQEFYDMSGANESASIEWIAQGYADYVDGACLTVEYSELENATYTRTNNATGETTEYTEDEWVRTDIVGGIVARNMKDALESSKWNFGLEGVEFIEQ